MRVSRSFLAISLLCTFLLAVGCSAPDEEQNELIRFPADSFENLLTIGNVTLDTETSSDGNGSLRILFEEGETIPLYTCGDLDVEDAIITYYAEVRSEQLNGIAYLEMWCDFEGGETYFSRGLDMPFTGSADWTTLKTPFLLKEGQNPTNIRLNLVVEGSGMIWIDKIRLLRSPH